MAKSTFTMSSLGLVQDSIPSVWFKTKAGKGVVSKETFLAALSKTNKYSFQVQFKDETGAYNYAKDSEGAQLYARQVNNKKLDAITMRNKLFAYCTAQDNPSQYSIEIIVEE